MAIFSGFEEIVRQSEPLAMHTWYHLGGPAEYFAEPRNTDELIALVERCAQEGLTLRLMGRGTNLLVRDEGVSGMVVRLSDPEFCKIKIQGETVRAMSGVKLGHAVTSAVHAGLAGLESLIGIPGTLGGALHGNAGTNTTDIGSWVQQATVVSQTGQVATYQRNEMTFSYRESSLDEPIILEAVFQLEQEDPHELARRLQKHWIVRKSSQPMGHQCAGCVFKNPQGMRAGQLLEDAGLKGTRIGGAVVSDRHANFIIAEPEATSSDVLRLIDLLRTQIHDRFDIELELEIDIW